MTEPFLDDIPPPSDQEYRDHDGFNQSTAWRVISESPRHAFEYRRWQRNSRGKPDPDHSRDREIGTVVHKLLLGSTTDYRVLDYDDYRTKEAQRVRSACEVAGVTPILAADLERCQRAANAVREQLREEFNIDLDGKSEVCLYWDESAPGGAQNCKAKLDHIRADGVTVLDFKSGVSANPKGLMRRILDAGCHFQAAWYLRGLTRTFPELTGRVRFIDIFLETSGLTMCTPVEIGGSLLELGERARQRALAKWIKCADDGYYPGYVDRVICPAAPAWALQEEMMQDD